MIQYLLIGVLLFIAGMLFAYLLLWLQVWYVVRMVRRLVGK